MNLIVTHFGTFDVANYGDLLFPLLARRQLGDIPGIQFQAVSPVGGAPDIRDCEPCLGILDVVENAACSSAVLIGGGNIIHCSPSSHGSYGVDARGRLAYGDLWMAPTFFMPKDVPILWNAPGVPNPISGEYHALVRQSLERTNYLSVRDEVSRGYLLDIWADADISVVPDSAWAIDKLWNRQELSDAYNSFLERYEVKISERIIVIHVNRRYLNNLKTRELADRLDKIATEFSARPVLLAIGVCHGDDVLARDVGAHMKSSPVIVDNPISLREIVSVIANAGAYIGSSMHGLITACAFGVPAVAVASRKMIKFGGLVEFSALKELLVETWDDASEVLRQMNIDVWQKNIQRVHERAINALEVHWGRIRSDIIMYKESSHGVSDNSQSAWRNLRKYQGELLSITSEVTENLLKKQIKILDAELKKTRNSFSWKITRPLRYVTRNFPTLSGYVQRSIINLGNAHRKLLGSLMYDYKISIPGIESRLEKYQESPMREKRKIAIYTAIFGQYDNLLLPSYIDDEADYICFTDKPRNGYGLWKIRMSPYHNSDPTRMARYIKTHPHDLLRGYDVAVWIDANILMNSAVSKYIDIVHKNSSGIGMVPHPYRNCFYEEAEACKILNKDAIEIIDRQVSHYKKAGLKCEAGMFETGFMVIRLDDNKVKELFQIWWRQIECFSRRDQLGLVWSVRETNTNIVHLLPKGVSVREDEDFQYYAHELARNIKFQLPADSIIEPVTEEKYINVRQLRVDSKRDVPIDIIVCVYNALEDVKLCLESAHACLEPGHNIIIVNDCSDSVTSDFLRQFTHRNSNVRLIENEINLGYTRSANIGLAAGNAEFRILLNSDTIVSKDWATKMLDAAYSRESIGIVGPLSNAAGSQSIPNTKNSGSNTAINALPSGVTPAMLDLACEQWSFADTLPIVPLIHGFCFGIKLSVINKIGFFDDKNFKRYYGEENDYCFRAKAAGFDFVVATHTFVYHRKSRSIEEEDRIMHMAEAGKRLRELYGVENIRIACRNIEEHPLLERMRNEASAYFKLHNDSNKKLC